VTLKSPAQLLTGLRLKHILLAQRCGLESWCTAHELIVLNANDLNSLLADVTVYGFFKRGNAPITKANAALLMSR